MVESHAQMAKLLKIKPRHHHSNGAYTQVLVVSTHAGHHVVINMVYDGRARSAPLKASQEEFPELHISLSWAGIIQTTL